MANQQKTNMQREPAEASQTGIELPDASSLVRRASPTASSDANIRGVQAAADDGSTAGDAAAAAAAAALAQPRVSKWRAGSVVLGSLCLTIPTYGLMSAWGLFQVYWQENQLADRSPTEISWIGSVFGFLDCFMDLPFGMVFDRWGARAMLPVGCLVYGGSFLALAWCSTHGQFVGCLAAAGVSAAIPTTVGMCVVDDWFSEHRAFAMGLVSTGAPIGGILFSLVLKALFARYDWQTSMFCLASIISGFLLVGSVLVKSRSRSSVQQQQQQQQQTAAVWDFKHFRDASFLLFTFCVFVFEFVLYTQWGSLPVFAVMTSLGDVFYLQMTYNIGAILGRTAAPWQAVRWGPFNMLLVMTAFTILTISVVWIPFGSTYAAALYVVACFMGIGTGAFVPLSATCLSRLCNDRGYGKWLGSCYTIVSFATLVGNPINQAILEKAGPRISVAFQGALLLVAFVACGVVRWLHLDRRWKWHGMV